MNVNVTTSGGRSQIAVGSSNVVQSMLGTGNVTDEDLKGYIEFLYEEETVDVENSTVWEAAESFFGHDLNQAQLDRVFALMRDAKVEVNVKW